MEKRGGGLEHTEEEHLSSHRMARQPWLPSEIGPWNGNENAGRGGLPASVSNSYLFDQESQEIKEQHIGQGKQQHWHDGTLPCHTPRHVSKDVGEWGRRAGNTVNM